MKNILLFLILFCAIALPALGELTDADLNKIRLIVNDSEKRIKTDIKADIAASEKRMKEYIDTKIEGINGRITGIEGRFTGVDGRFTGLEGQITTLTYLVYALIAPIVIAVGIPQIIITLRDNSNRERDRKIEQLTQEIENLKQQRITNP